jgi:hypothetical protein
MVKPESVTPEKQKRGRPKGSKNKISIEVGRRRASVADPPRGILGSLNAEIDEAIELQRPHFPNDDEATLRVRAEQFRSYRYRHGWWPDFVAEAKKQAAERAAAESAFARELAAAHAAAIAAAAEKDPED